MQRSWGNFLKKRTKMTYTTSFLDLLSSCSNKDSVVATQTDTQTSEREYSPETGPHIYVQLIFNKIPRPFNQKRVSFQQMVL